MGTDPQVILLGPVKSQGLPRAKSPGFLLCGEKGKWPKQQEAIQVLNDGAGDRGAAR